jgi:hypothetical protein
LGAGSQPVTQSSGDKGIPFSVLVGTSTTVRLYTADVRDREIFFQNTDSTYYVYCSTFTPVSASSGNRFALPPKPVGITTNATYNINCIAESSAGSATIEIIGVIERDSKD